MSENKEEELTSKNQRAQEWAEEMRAKGYNVVSVGAAGITSHVNLTIGETPVPFNNVEITYVQETAPVTEETWNKYKKLSRYIKRMQGTQISMWFGENITPRSLTVYPLDEEAEDSSEG